MAYLENITPLFIDYCAHYMDYADAQQAITDAGTLPAYPIIVVADVDYTAVTSTRAAWYAGITPLREDVSSAFQTINQDIYNLIGGGLVADTWTALSADTTGDFSPFPDNVWIGYSKPPIPLGMLIAPLDTLVPSLIIADHPPGYAFPNI